MWRWGFCPPPALHVGGCLAPRLLLFIALTGSAALALQMETEHHGWLRTLSLSCVLKVELLSRLLVVGLVLRRSRGEQARGALALSVSACLPRAAFQLCRSPQSTLGLSVAFVSLPGPSLATLELVVLLQPRGTGL